LHKQKPSCVAVSTKNKMIEIDDAQIKVSD